MASRARLDADGHPVTVEAIEAQDVAVYNDALRAMADSDHETAAALLTTLVGSSTVARCGHRDASTPIPPNDVPAVLK